MEALFLFSIVAVFVGALLAWFHRRTFWNLCIKTALATLVLIAVAILILDGPPDNYSPAYLFSGLAYFIYPYVIFVLVPGIATAGLTLLIRRKLRPKGAIETPPVSRQKV
jgi:CHASE2 domain-containing sensor protein